MKRIAALWSSLLLLLPVLSEPALGQRDMNLGGQLVSAVEELKEKMQADPDIRGRKLRLGKFTGPKLPDSNFDLEFERRFRQLMGEHLVEESELFVSGEYDFLPGKLEENQGLHVIQFEITITDRSRRTLQSVTREINRSDDIVKITGGTVALPETKSVAVRNKAAKEAVIFTTMGAGRGRIPAR